MSQYISAHVLLAVRRIREDNADLALVSRPAYNSPALAAWERERPSDFSNRLLSYTCAPVPYAHPRAIPRSSVGSFGSTCTSLNVQSSGDGQTESSSFSMAATNSVPELSQPSNSASVRSFLESIDTNLASDLGSQNLLEEDEDGNLVVPQNERAIANYQCLFRILSCEKTFDRIDHWKTHVQSHFRTCPPPNTGQCPVPPCTYSTQSSRRGEAWGALLDHVAEAHILRGESLENARPDIDLMHYMYCNNIISQDQLRLIQLPAAHEQPGYSPVQGPVRSTVGSSDEPCFTYANIRRERRIRERHPRVGLA